MKKYIFAGVAVFLLFLGLVNFSPLFTGKKIFRQLNSASPIVLSGKTLFISDLHIKKISDINTGFDVDNLIIVGDFFHTPGYFSKLGKSDEDAFAKVFSKLISNNATTNVYYILSANAHDPRLEPIEEKINNVDFHIIGEVGHFVLNGTDIVAIHGDQINSTGLIPCVVSYFSIYFGKPLLLEKTVKNFIGLDKNEWLIMGHSHVPGIDYQGRVANTGSWTGIPFLFVQTRTGILFDRGEVKLIQY